MEAIDRDNPCGKRDYAIILLIARLGLRGVDIRRLEFADFDWAGNRLAVTQAKTGHKVWLPLLKEVGWAVIDDVRHGRPGSDCLAELRELREDLRRAHQRLDRLEARTQHSGEPGL